MALETRNGIVGKVCSSCKGWKPLDGFYRDGSHGATQAGRHCRCKECYKKGRQAQKAN